MIISDKLNIYSLNCGGLNRSFDYISYFLQNNNCDILCVQELWILECNIKTLGVLVEDYLYTGISGVDDKEKIIQGRPPVDVGILYKKSLSGSIIHINSTNRRICGVNL